MSSTGRHARRPARSLARTPLRAGLLLTLAGGAAFAATGTAHATESGGPGALETVGHAIAPVTQLQLYPLGGTGVDPLSNGVEAGVADFQPVNTTDVTGAVAEDSSLAGIVRHVGGLLGGGT